MRIALISPYSRGPMRGNITTVNRITASLAEAAADVIVLPVDAMSYEEMLERLTAFAPQIIHGFHARYCGDTARRLAGALSVPFVVTLTGSDFNDSDMLRHPDTGSTLSAASRIVCFDRSIKTRVDSLFPGRADRICVIPQAVCPPPVTGIHDFGLPSDAFVLLLPAALRPVKNIESPIRALAGLCSGPRPPVLVIAGGDIDPEYAARIRRMITGSSSSIWLGEVPYEQMGDLYTRADVVLNCSLFEGMPNTLMEAMALGRPVLAVDIPGNRQLVDHERTGLLYRTESELAGMVMRLRDDPDLCDRLGQSAARSMIENFQPHQEAERYSALYRDVLEHRT